MGAGTAAGLLSADAGFPGACAALAFFAGAAAWDALLVGGRPRLRGASPAGAGAAALAAAGGRPRLRGASPAGAGVAALAADGAVFLDAFLVAVAAPP